MKKIWKSPWTIAIVSAFLAPIATIIIDAIMEKPFLSTLWIIIKTLWRWLGAFLTFELKVWWVLLGIGGIAGVVIIAAIIRDIEEDNQPAFLSYKEDYFGSWKWSWVWKQYNHDKKWYIESLKAHCPHCGTPMFSDDYELNFRCPRCDYSTNYGGKHKRSYEVKALIIDNLNRQNNI